MLKLVPLLALIVTAGIAVAVTGSGATGGGGFTIAGGVAGGAFFDTEEQSILDGSGAIAEDAELLGRRAGRSFYTLPGTDDRSCYAAEDASGQLSDVVCLHEADALTTALIDMSTVVIDPETSEITQLEAVSGIAADQVATVGVETNDGIEGQTAVADNVYYLDPDAIPADAAAIVALDAEGHVLERKPLAG